MKFIVQCTLQYSIVTHFKKSYVYAQVQTIYKNGHMDHTTARTQQYYGTEEE